MAGVGVELTLCTWMVIVAVCLTPLTWMGTPKVNKNKTSYEIKAIFIIRLIRCPNACVGKAL